MKRTSKQKPRRSRKTKTLRLKWQKKYRLNYMPQHWLIYFYGPNNNPICGITTAGDVEWNDGKIQVNYLKRAFNSSITLACEAQAGIKSGMRRRMVLKTFKHIKNKVKNLSKQELVKYINTTTKKLEKKETLRILQGKD